MKSSLSSNAKRFQQSTDRSLAIQTLAFRQDRLRHCEFARLSAEQNECSMNAQRINWAFAKPTATELEGRFV